MTIYERIIYHTATKNLVAKNMLMIMANSPATVWKQIKRAIDNGLMKERSIRVKTGSSTYKEDYLMITKAGLDYLCSLGYDETKWLSSIPRGTKIIASPFLGAAKVHRFLAISANAIIAEEIGIETPPLFFREDACKNENSLMACVMAAYQAKMDEMERQMQSGQDASPSMEANAATLSLSAPIDVPPLFFCTAPAIKRGFESQNDVMRGKYTGAFIAGDRVILSYVVLKGQLVLTQDECSQNRKAYYHLLGTFDLSPKAGPRDSVVFVKSPKEFSKSFFGKSEREFKKMLTMLTLSGIREFCVFPMLRKGIASFYSYLMGADREDEIYAIALESGRFTPNKVKYNEELFPLLRTDQAPTAIGIKLDLVKLYRIIKVSCSHPEETFGVICYDWQVPYYQRIDCLNLIITAINTKRRER